MTGTCICKVGYTGRRCDDVINLCDSPNPPCKQMEMYCRPETGFYTCACRDGFVLSDIDYCAPCPPYTHSNNCSSICDCVLQNTLYCEGGSCVCKIGWGGQKCGESSNDCYGVICPEGTRCVDNHRSHQCLCDPGTRYIKGVCKEFTVKAVTLTPNPGVGELVDIFILYKLPDIYSANQIGLPDFVYTLEIEEPRKQLCQFSYKDTFKFVSGSEEFFSELKIDSRAFNFYSHIMISFSEANISVVHLVPGSREYDELMLEFDVRFKTQAEIECLQGMRISGTSHNMSTAVKHNRQAYHIFRVRLNQSKECTQAPDVEWKYFSISNKYLNNYLSCMHGKDVSELDIEDLTEAADEKELSDHASMKEVIPKSTLPLGYILICVMAYVHNNRRFRASTCGYIYVEPSNIIVGQLLPHNNYTSWGVRWGITLTANFSEPDLYTPLTYQWSCIMLVDRYLPRNCSGDTFFINSAEKKEAVLSLKAGFLPPNNDIVLAVTVQLNPHASVTQSLHLEGDGNNTRNFPVIIICERNCRTIIGIGRDMVLRATFAYKLNYLLETTCHWSINASGKSVEGADLKRLLSVPEEWAGRKWEEFKATVNGSALTSDVIYTVYVTCSVTTNEGLGEKMRRYPITYFSNTQYWFQTTGPPRGKGCTISPTKGEAVFTRFTVECNNYTDPSSNLPLMFRLFQYERVLGKGVPVETLIAFSGSRTIGNITLSTSAKSGTTRVNLTVNVESVRGTKVQVPLYVTLTTLDQAQALKRAIGHMKTGTSGQAAARAMKDVATIISVDETAAFQDKVDTRRELLRNIDKLDSRSKNSIEQVSHVLSISVEKEKEIESLGLDYGIKTAHKLAKFLGKLSNENTDVINNVATVQVNALSKLLNVAAAHGHDISYLNETEVLDKHNLTQQNIRQSVLAVQSIANVANVLLNSISKVNSSIKVPTEFMDFIVTWNNVSKDTQFAVDSDSANFSIPSTHAGVLKHEIVESEFEVFKKNPYGWTAGGVHGNMSVIKARLVRQNKKYEIRKVKQKFRFGKPADIFLNFKAPGEKSLYGFTIKVVKRGNIQIIERSECLFMTIQASTTNATILKVTSPDNLKIVVKTKYTNDVKYFNKINDHNMMEMPLSIPNTLMTSQGLLRRENNLLIFPQLTNRQIKKNVQYYRVKINVKLNQPVNTTLLTLVDLTRNISTDDNEEAGEYYNVTLEVMPHIMACLHFNEVQNDFVSNECAISMFSNLRTLHCRCITTAAYTGSVLVLPRLLNPLHVSLFLEIFQNPLVVSVVIAVWLIYFTLISWGRVRDKEDITKNDVTVLDDIRPEYNYVYLICVVTGWSASASTSSNVFIYLNGSWYMSETHVLQDPTRRLFQSGAENWFMLTTRSDIGDLVSVVVWTDFSGASPSWYLSSVYVENMQTNESWVCPFNDWIGIRHGRDMLRADVPAYKETDFVSHRKLQLIDMGQDNIRNEHLWFGIFVKTPHNIFTRVRRLTTCLTLLQSVMILNLIFFGMRKLEAPGRAIEILDQTIYLSSFIIGIQTSFIIFMLGMFLSFIFTRIAPPPKHIQETEDKKENILDSLQRSYSIHLAQETTGSAGIDIEQEESSESEYPTLDTIYENINESARSTDVDTMEVLEDTQLKKESFDENSTISSVVSSRTSDNVDGGESAHGLAKSSDVDAGYTIAKVYAVTKHDRVVRTQGFEKRDVQVTVDETFTPSVYMLPWWFIYVVWTVLAIYNLFFAYYIMLYGLSLEYDKSVDWTLAFFTGFLTNVFVIQPVKVIFMVLILVLIFHQAYTIKDRAPVTNLHDGMKLVQEKNKYNRKFCTLLPKLQCRPPLHTADARLVMRRHATEKTARENFRDVVLYTMFMISVILVAHEYLEVESQFLQTQYVKNKFLKTPIINQDESKGCRFLGILEKALSVEDMFDYLSTVVAPEIIQYKDVDTDSSDFYLLGTARIRQVRAMNVSTDCQRLPKALGNLLFEEGCSCQPIEYTEDTNNYDNTWQVPYNNTEGVEDDSPYIYQRDDSIFEGNHGVYSGGGYVIPFEEEDLDGMEDALASLYKSDWINELTKCVFVELTLYNAGTGFFTNIMIAFEFTKLGGLYQKVNVYSTRLFYENKDKKVWLSLSEGFIVIYILFYTMVQIQYLRKVGFKDYILNIWNWFEVATILLSAVVGICMFLRYYEFMEVMKQFHKYGNSRFLNFHRVYQKQAHLHASMSMLGGLVIFKMLKATAFGTFVCRVIRTLKYAQEGIRGMLRLTVIFLIVISLTACLFFGKIDRSFRSFEVSMFNILVFVMGEPDYESLVEAHAWLGHIFVIVVTIATQIFIVNLFCILLLEGYERTRYVAFRQEREIVQYIWKTVKLYSGFGPQNVKKKIKLV